MNLKVLPLERWMLWDSHPRNDDDQELGSERYPEVQVVFNRNGRYCKGKECWLEINGKAYRDNLESFAFVMRAHDMEKYNQRQIDALINFVRQGMATKQQKQLLHDIGDAIQLRSTYRGARMHARRAGFRKNKKNYAPMSVTANGNS